MNRYMIVCRLRWPAILLLTGIIALLAQMDVLSWGHAWPLYLILWGVLALAERAAIATNPTSPMAGAPQPAGYAYGAGYPGYAPQGAAYPSPSPYPGVYTGPVSGPAAPQAPASTGIVPVPTDLELRSTELQHEPRKSWEEEGR